MDKWHLRGQAAMEFIVLVGVLLFVFSIMLGIISNKITHIDKKKDIILGEDIVTKVQKEVNLAARVLDGYSREFILPQRLGNKEYNVSIMGDEVVVSTKKQDFWRVIPPVIGNITKGSNRINKTNGIIYLN